MRVKLFFQEDRVILTEGQEDVLLYPRVAEQLGLKFHGSFFGWGAGGAGNIPHLCQILKDLGLTRVAGLLDADKQLEAEALCGDFPDYYFACIPAIDIRTKPARRATDAVQGLLDEKLLLRGEYHESMRAILIALSAHMDA